MPLERACRRAGPFAPLSRARIGLQLKLDREVVGFISSSSQQIECAGHRCSFRHWRIGAQPPRQALDGAAARCASPDRVTPEEIAPAAPQPVVSANGVPLLQIPAWRELPWLWHGFSTAPGRREPAGPTALRMQPGELNLGFTPADDRRKPCCKTADCSRRRSRATRRRLLITVRQFHPKLIAAVRRSEG